MSTPPAEPSPSAQQPRVCVVSLAGGRFAVEVRHAREVVVLEDYTVVPLAPPHLVGVANLRGAIMPLVDIRPFLGLPPTRTTRQPRALVVEHDGAQAGLLIDEVLGLEPLDALMVQSGEDGVSTDRREREGSTVTLLDVGRILAGLAGDAQAPEEAA